MFNKKLTISELLDKKAEQEIKQLKKYKKRYDKNAKQVEIIIIKQFNIAELILGYRLTMKKQHEHMYYFYFSYKYANCYIHSSEELNVNMKFKLTPYNPSISYLKNLGEIYEKEFKLTELSKILIRWIEIITESSLKEK